jgi:hypothetical protein
VRAKRGHALFHAIVTMGAASVEACGGVTMDSSHTGDGQGVGSAGSSGRASAGADTGGAATSPTSGPFGNGGSNGFVDAGSAGVIGIGGNQLLDGGSPSMCAHPEQFQCTTWYPTPQGCSCDLNAPLSAADCTHPQQFQCMIWDPIPQSCSCNTTAPLSAADCDAGSNQQLYCHSYTPQVGCYCTCVICIH